LPPSPDASAARERGRPFLFVVNDKDVVEQRRVTLGQVQDGLRVVKEGLTADDWVVVRVPEGLQAGMAIKPKKEMLADPGPERPR
jgi:multidrug efflux pump subunit AcrA (membrane-fusion protein)